jgi:hypothetical protein
MKNHLALLSGQEAGQVAGSIETLQRRKQDILHDLRFSKQ